MGQVNQTIASLYKWLDFKAKPVKFTDFKQFVQSINSLINPTWYQNGPHYADNLLLAIYDKSFGTKRRLICNF